MQLCLHDGWHSGNAQRKPRRVIRLIYECLARNFDLASSSTAKSKHYRCKRPIRGDIDCATETSKLNSGSLDPRLARGHHSPSSDFVLMGPEIPISLEQRVDLRNLDIHVRHLQRQQSLRRTSMKQLQLFLHPVSRQDSPAHASTLLSITECRFRRYPRVRTFARGKMHAPAS